MELFTNTDRDYATGWFGCDLNLGAVENLREEDGVTRFDRPVLEYAGDKWVPSGKTAKGAMRGNFV
jgi:hypothetical protein